MSFTNDPSSVCAAINKVARRDLRSDQVYAIVEGWAGWESAPWDLAAVWPVVAPYDTSTAPQETVAAEALQPPDPELLEHLSPNDVTLLQDAAHVPDWRVLQTWRAVTTDLLDGAKPSAARDHAAVVLMDVTAVTDPHTALWATAEAFRAALKARHRKRQAARAALTDLYAVTRPHPLLVRRAVNLTPIIEVAGRVYAV